MIIGERWGLHQVLRFICAVSASQRPGEAGGLVSTYHSYRFKYKPPVPMGFGGQHKDLKRPWGMGQLELPWGGSYLEVEVNHFNAPASQEKRPWYDR